MPIKVHNFMGKLGWNARKYFPKLASDSYLKLQFVTRRKLQASYVDYFLGSEEPPQPLVVNIETINRCNSTCEFCTANRNAEKRPFKKIDEKLFYSIIDQLADWGFKGHLTLYGNNEPWIDTRIVEFHKYCREKLPDSFIFMSTNGLLLDVDTVKPRLGVFSFTNPNGLIRTDAGSFLVSENSGEPENASRADYTIYQGSLESSNVDLSQEMTNLIIAQRAYQFSTKVVTTSDEIEQLVNSLRG